MTRREDEEDAARDDPSSSASIVVPSTPASAASCEIIPTHARTIDDALRGGIRTRMLTEIVGESGAAKSHLCCQLALCAQLAFPSGASVVYVHTEGPPPVRRLRALATSRRFIEHFGSAERASAALDRIYIVNALGDGDAMLDALGSLSAALRYPVDANAPVRMIIVDSVAAPFRDELGGASAGGHSSSSSSSSSWAYTMRRAGTLHKATMLLKEYAARHDLACVVTNHVVDSMRSNGANANGDETRVLRAIGEAMTSGRLVVPALGLAWGHCVNARCFVTRRAKRRAVAAVAGDEGGNGDDDNDASSVERTFRVVYAPHCAPTAVGFVVRDDGAWGAE